MADGSVVGPIVAAVILLLLVLFLKSTIYIVSQAEGIVIERFGRFDRILTAGVNFVWPISEQPRRFTWRKTFLDESGRVKDMTTTDYRVDLRESVYNFLRQDVYTKDTVLLEVNAIMYYSISDTRKAIYEVDDLDSAIQNTAQSQIKEVFGSTTFKEALSSQVQINAHMKKNFAAGFEKWGITVHRIELLDMSPKSSSDTSRYMKREVIAERTRRAEFIEAEGNKAAMRLTSEGTKMVKSYVGIAEQESTRKRSEGQAAAKVALARAEKAAFDLMNDVLESDSCSQTQYMITQSFLELFRDVSASVDDKVIYLPFDMQAISGLVRGLSGVYGRKATPPPVNAVSGTRRGPAAGAGAGAASGPTTVSGAFGELN
jgi:regulator of protease activity HflC (stomatin/prohibitin superfamily)